MSKPVQSSQLNPATSYSLLTLFSLYLAQGLPVGFMTQALPALLRHYGVSLTQIGLSGLLMAPWAIKFLWAPLVDRRALNRMGHYRSWILVTQGCTILALLGLAYVPPSGLQHSSALWGFFCLLLCMNLCCATQDIAADGLAVNVLRQGAVHWGNTFQVMGSRFGFIFGGGAVLYAIDFWSWKTTFLALALGVMINSLPILFYREPCFHQRSCTSMSEAASDTVLKKNRLSRFQYFLQRLFELYGHLWTSKELKWWLLLILTFKIADGLSGPVLKPMMIDMGLSLAQIGLNVTMLGAACALMGAWLAGWMIKHYSIAKMLLFFSILQSLGIIYYLILAYLFEQHIFFSLYHLYIANAVEELLSAMSLVAILSLMMIYARERFAATDFSFQVGLMSIITGLLYVMGGKIADLFGYVNVLTVTLIISVICLIPKIFWWKNITSASPLQTRQHN